MNYVRKDELLPPPPSKSNLLNHSLRVVINHLIICQQQSTQTPSLLLCAKARQIKGEDMCRVTAHCC